VRVWINKKNKTGCEYEQTKQNKNIPSVVCMGTLRANRWVLALPAQDPVALQLLTSNPSSRGASNISAPVYSPSAVPQIGLQLVRCRVFFLPLSEPANDRKAPSRAASAGGEAAFLFSPSRPRDSPLRTPSPAASQPLPPSCRPATSYPWLIARLGNQPLLPEPDVLLLCALRYLRFVSVPS